MLNESGEKDHKGSPRDYKLGLAKTFNPTLKKYGTLCDHLEGWDKGGWEGGRRKREEIWGYMYMYS